MDVFGEHEALRSRSVACHVSSEGIWRIDRFTGPTDVLEAVDRVYADHDRCLDCLTGIHDPQSTVHETLGASSGLRTVYTFRDVTSDCYEVPGLTYKYISKDVLSKSKRQGDTEEWWLPPPRQRRRRRSLCRPRSEPPVGTLCGIRQNPRADVLG